MNTAVFSVVYPGMEAYFPQFLDTLSKQTVRDFTVFLINDGMSNVDRFLKRTVLDVKVKDAEGTPAALRKMGIKWLMEVGAKVIILADSDDCFSDNRIEVSRNILDRYDLVFNELILTGQGLSDSKPMIGTRFKDGEVINCTYIRTANCMGLSNTALRAKSVPIYFDQIPNNIIAFDWIFLAICLHAGAKGVFTKKTATYYRQHDNNIAYPRSFKEEQILRGVKIKSDHYRVLSNFYKEYMTLSDIFSKLQEKLQSDEKLRRRYCLAVRKHAPAVPLWWEAIKTLEELGL